MAKSAGAGRGFVNPPTIAESKDPDYMSHSTRYELEAERDARKQQEAAEKAYTAATKNMKSGGSASSRADGIAQRGKTRGKMIMCGGGMARK
jgi:hypothetical protein